MHPSHNRHPDPLVQAPSNVVDLRGWSSAPFANIQTSGKDLHEPTVPSVKAKPKKGQRERRPFKEIAHLVVQDYEGAAPVYGGRIPLLQTETGRSKRVWVQHGTLAERSLADIILKHERDVALAATGVDPRNGARLFQDLCGSYLTRKAGRKRSIRDDGYRLAELCKFIGKVPVERLTITTLERALDQIRAEPMKNGKLRAENTIHKYASIMKSVLKDAKRIGLVERNSAVDLNVTVRANPRFDHYSPAQLAAAGVALLFIKPQVRLLFELALYTGARVGELRELKRIDIDSDAGTMVLRKTKSGRVIKMPLSPPALQVCQDAEALCRPDNDHLFQATRGPKCMSYPGKELKRGLEAAGIKGMAFHAARRSIGTEAIRCPSVTILDVSQLLCHSNTKVTEDHYLVTGDDRIRNAVTLASAKLSAHLGLRTLQVNGQLLQMLAPSVRSVCISRHVRFVTSGRAAML